MSKILSEKNLYYNGAMYAPDGTLLCKVSKKRLEWYLNRGLAEKIKDDPLEIKLKFVPDYDLNQKLATKKTILNHMNNVCVVCGTTECLTKHHVVPHSFRAYFPVDVKKNFSHDIVLLCTDHHEEYERHSDDLRKILRKQYEARDISIPLDTDKCRRSKLARALIEHGDKIPEDKKNHIKAELAGYVDVNNPVQLAELAEYKDKSIKLEVANKKIVEEQKSLDDFMIMWRKHFLDCMKPQFMPEGWNANLRLGV